MRDEITDLIFQTTRISSMIHDLLLLSRLDAGRLELQMDSVDLSRTIDSLLDDLSAVPDVRLSDGKRGRRKLSMRQ